MDVIPDSESDHYAHFVGRITHGRQHQFRCFKITKQLAWLFGSGIGYSCFDFRRYYFLQHRNTFSKIKQASVENSPFIKINTLNALQLQLEQAKKVRKAVFLDFSADWCGDCQEMDTKVFNQPEIQKAMSDWVSIKVDISDKNAEVDSIKKAFGIYGTPTIIFFNTSGEPITQMTSVGLISLSKMLQLLEQARHLS